MEIFLANFFMASIFEGSIFLMECLIFLLIIWGCIQLVLKIHKMDSFERCSSYAELDFKKAKWDAMESSGDKRLKRFGIYGGWTGAGIEYEHDNRD